MALRIRRRRRAAQVEEVARGALELASGVAAEALAEVKKRPSRARRVGLGLVAVAVLSAVATALYIWWTRRREDEEFARLMQEPNEWPPTVPVPTPPAPTVHDEESQPAASALSTPPAMDSAPAAPSVTPVVADAPAQPVQAVAQPWTASSANATSFGQSEGVSEPTTQRPAWNSHRDVPLFVLPPRPNVPYRGAMTPSVDRTHLPGSSSFIR